MKSPNVVSSRKLRRLFVAVLLAMLVLLGLLTTLTLAQIELPPAGSTAFIQTSGPNTGLNIGDWYTNAGQGNRPHNFRLFVPCTVVPTQVFTIELFDPEVFSGGTAIDEVRGAADSTTFELRAPDDTVIATNTYPSAAATDDVWNVFATFTPGVSGCGVYTLFASTSDDDDNAWRLRITPDDPDGVPGSGDELALAAFETSFQHTVAGCQSFYFFVPVTTSIRLNNFDIDYPGVDPTASVTYYPPGGGVIAGTPSGSTVWNNGGDASNRGGDIINDPTPGWWRAEICVIGTPIGNQYIFEPEGLPFSFQQPLTPAMTLSKDDGQTIVTPGQVVTYTITYMNQGTGAALNTILTETLPASTTYVACSGGSSCGEAQPGVVTYSLGTVAASTGGQVGLTIQIDDTVPPSSTLTNTARIGYEDTLGNDYPPLEVTDVNETTSSPTPTPTPTPTLTPTPTPTPIPPTPTPTPTPTSSPPPAPPASPPPPTQPPSSQPPSSQPPSSAISSPTPAVSFLPETGVGHPPAFPLWPLAALPVLGLLAVWTIHRRKE